MTPSKSCRNSTRDESAPPRARGCRRRPGPPRAWRGVRQARSRLHRFSLGAEADDEVDPRARPQCAADPRPLGADLPLPKELRMLSADPADAAVGAGEQLPRRRELEPDDVLDVAQPGPCEADADHAGGRDRQSGSAVAVEIT